MTARELRIAHDGVTLVATYTPAGKTAIVALHGAGMGTRDFFLYRHLHRVLPPAGIGVVTFDRRGEGASTGEPSRGRFQVQAEDALAVRDALDVARVGLWGFSQGAWIGPLAAVASDRIAFLALVASTGVTPSAQMMYATGQQLRRAGYGTEVVERALTLRRDFEAWVHAPAPDREVALSAALRVASQEPWWRLLYLPSHLPPEPAAAAWRRRWIEEMDFDPLPSFRQVRVPALLFYGEDDDVSPVVPSIEAWRRARPDGVEIAVVPAATHELTLPDGSLSPEYERRLVDWLVGRSHMT